MFSPLMSMMLHPEIGRRESTEDNQHTLDMLDCIDYLQRISSLGSTLLTDESSTTRGPQKPSSRADSAAAFSIDKF